MPPLAPLLIAALVLAPALACARPAQATPPASAPPAASAASAASANPHLVEQGQYRNVDGVAVHAPAHTDTGARPAGASAQCRDGSDSFSLHHRGTRSPHGGVAQWLWARGGGTARASSAPLSWSRMAWAPKTRPITLLKVWSVDKPRPMSKSGAYFAR
jgi:hypothetical protein